MGRWLERVDNTTRVINNFARITVENGSDMVALQQSLSNAAAIRGIPTEDPSLTLELLLRRHEISSIYHSLTTARGNATHIGTMEPIRALSEAVLTLEDDNAMPQTPLDALLLTNQVLDASAPSIRSSTRIGSIRKPSPRRRSTAASSSSSNNSNKH